MLSSSLGNAGKTTQAVAREVAGASSQTSLIRACAVGVLGRKRGFSMVLVPFLVAVALALGGPAPAAAGKEGKPPEKYRQWLERDVAYIITKEEKDTFRKLPTDEDRDKFIDRFWEIRNPDPGSSVNTFKDEHYRRLTYADEHFGNEGATDGWRTDRGRVYVTLGPPEQRAVYYGYENLRSMEIWFYSSKTPALPPFFYVLFYQRDTGGAFRLYSPYMDGPDKLVTTGRATNNRLAALKVIQDAAGREVARTSLSLLPDEPVDWRSATATLQSDILLSTIRNLANHPLAKAELDQRRELLRSVTARLIFEGQGLDVLAVPLRDSQGLTRCHYLLRLQRPEQFALERLPSGRYRYSVEARVRVFGRENKPIFTLEKALSAEIDKDRVDQIKDAVFGYEGWIPLPPGKYKLDFLLTNWVSKAAYRGEKEVVIPDAPVAGIVVTSVVPFSDAEMVDPVKTNLIPFAAAGVKFAPLTGQQLLLAPTQGLNFFYQIWAPRKDPRSYQGQTLQVEYTFGRPGARGDSKVLREEVRKEQFDSSGSLLNGKKISLEGLQPGNYLLIITVTDPPSQIKAYGSMNFRVVPEQHFTPAWDVYDESIAADVDKGVPEFQRGLCYLDLGDKNNAALWFRKALEKNPSNEAARARLVDIYFGQQDFTAATALYSPASITGQTDEQSILRVAESFLKLGKLERAIDFLEAALRVKPDSGPLWLEVASYYQRAGNWEKAAEFERRGKAKLASAPAEP